MDQFADQEEEACGFEEKGTVALSLFKLFADTIQSITVTMDEAHRAEGSSRSVTTRKIMKRRRNQFSLWKVKGFHIIVDIQDVLVSKCSFPNIHISMAKLKTSPYASQIADSLGNHRIRNATLVPKPLGEADTDRFLTATSRQAT